MNIFGYAQIIPSENRREQMELRQRLGEAKFLEHVWTERKNATADKPKWDWPISNVVQEAAPPLTKPKHSATVSPIKRART